MRVITVKNKNTISSTKVLGQISENLWTGNLEKKKNFLRLKKSELFFDFQLNIEKKS